MSAITLDMWIKGQDVYKIMYRDGFTLPYDIRCRGGNIGFALHYTAALNIAYHHDQCVKTFIKKKVCPTCGKEE